MSTVQYLHHSITKSRLESNSILNNSPSHLQYSRSSTKRIYESVFRIIDFDDYQEELPLFETEETNGSRVSHYINDEALLTHLYHKMKIEGVLDHYPILKVCCQQLLHSANSAQNNQLNYNALYQLQYSDISNMFSRFGDLNKIILTQDMKFAYVFFNTFHSAYVSCKLLNGLDFAGKMAKLHIMWADNNDYEYLMPNLNQYLNSINWHLMYKFCSTRQQQPLMQQTTANNSKQNKLTCRYEIQIHNERDFQVARRIIGSKGWNMKKIIQESIELAKTTQFYKSNPRHFDNINELLKLRLRGKGSGYKEGPEQQQSEQSLHLCVSAKDQICYQFACEKVQRLLQNVYEQYYEYTLQENGKGILMAISKNSFGSLSSGQDQSAIPHGEQISESNYSQPRAYYTQQQLNSLRITPQKICELLEMRNKARRQLNFLQADRIRNFLRNCGVCLIDEKGRRGRAMQVTTWKYIF